MKWIKGVVYFAGAALSVVYLLNPGLGVFEIIPDNIPFFGNIDEAAAVGLLIAAVKGLRGLKAKPDAPATAPGSGQPESPRAA